MRSERWIFWFASGKGFSCSWERKFMTLFEAKRTLSRLREDSDWARAFSHVYLDGKGVKWGIDIEDGEHCIIGSFL